MLSVAGIELQSKFFYVIGWKEGGHNDLAPPSKYGVLVSKNARARV